MGFQIKRGVGLGILSVVVLFLPTIARAQDWLSQVNVISEGETLEALVANAKPTFAWGPGDMLWVREPEPGKVVFEVNRALKVPGAKRWLVAKKKPGAASVKLLEGAPQAERLEVAPAPAPPTDGSAPPSYATVFEADPELGTLYRVRWANAPISAREGFSQIRDVFVLRRGDRWRFIGEGATDISGRGEPGSWFSESTQYRIQWMGKDDKPLTLAATHWRQLAEDADMPSRADLVTRRDGIIDSSTRVMRWDTHDYVIAQSGDTMDAIIERVTAWHARAEWKKSPDSHSAMTQKVRPLVTGLNPDVPSSGAIVAGTHVFVPDRTDVLAAVVPAR